MTALIVLIACSLLVAVGFLAAFLISVKTGQFDDTYTPSVRILFDDDNTATASKKGETKKSFESNGKNQ